MYELSKNFGTTWSFTPRLIFPGEGIYFFSVTRFWVGPRTDVDMEKCKIPASVGNRNL